MAKTVPSNVIKIYSQRGPLQQFRVATAVAFHCFRCGAEKKSKLHAIYRGDWAKRLCNACYGRLLSLYNIRARTVSDDKKTEELASLLITLVSIDDRRQAEQLLLAAETRAEHLAPETLRFLATAEHVAARHPSDLEWSPVIIGLCKAVESEVLTRLIVPLGQQITSLDITTDIKDKDIGRVAIFCADQNRKPPELGAIAHFLQTVIHSQHRRNSSGLIRVFLIMLADYSGSQWLLDPHGLHRSLVDVTVGYRNKAAHIDELDEVHYRQCRELVMGSGGILWKLHNSVGNLRRR